MDVHENGPAPRCPECNHKGGHSAHCRAGIDESRPMTSADRYRGHELPGRADADIAPTDRRPQGERYYPLDRPLPGALEEQPGVREYSDANAAGRAFGEPASPEELHLAATDPVAAARARAASAGLNPKDLVGAVKTPLGLLPWTALVQVAGVFAVGAKKYGAYNWRTKGQPVQHVTYVEAAFRHLAAYMDGQTIDPETGCNHLAHAACGLLILLDASAVGNSIDNRPTPGHAAEIMAIRREV
jgi:hypothetical protein